VQLHSRPIEVVFSSNSVIDSFGLHEMEKLVARQDGVFVVADHAVSQQTAN